MTYSTAPYKITKPTTTIVTPVIDEPDKIVYVSGGSSEEQDLSIYVEKQTGYSLVADTEISKIHASGSDNQDISGKVDKAVGYSLVADTEISKIHASGSDNQDISVKVDKVSGYSLVADTEISKIHASGSDNQDLSNLVEKVSGKELSENDLTDTLKGYYDSAYNHSGSTHAPTNAQKNSDITKEEIEAKLTGGITSHSHAISTHTSSHAVGGTDTIFPVDPNADKYLKWNDTSSQLEWADAGGSFSGDMDDIPDGTTYVKTENNYTDASVSKLSGIESGADITSTHEMSHSDVLVDGDIGVTVQALLVSATNIKTINSVSILGSGDMVVSGSMPRGHICGLTMSNAADTANDITIAVGEARDEANTGDLILASAITKRLDAGWAVGTNQGGLNTGSVADSTWYEVHLIKRVDTSVVDVMFTTTANRTTLPANYTLSRRIGWIRTQAAAAGIKQFSQTDDHFTWITQVNDVAASKATDAAAVTLTAPPNSIARFRATADMSTSVNANSVIVFSEIAEGAVTPALATGIGSLGYWDLVTGVSAGHFELRVSSTSTIEHDASVAVGAFDISTFGYIDLRCRLSNI